MNTNSRIRDLVVECVRILESSSSDRRTFLFVSS